jgi:hypothetical protein
LKVTAASEETTTKPSVTTNAATSITNTSATLNGKINSIGSSSVLEKGFGWGTSSGSLINEWKQAGTFSTGSFSKSLTGLTSGTKYYYKAKARNSSVWVYGSQLSFTAGTTSTGDEEDDELIQTLLLQIQQIMAQIAQLQEQLAVLTGTSVSWCHTFNTNLAIGVSGPEVEALQSALEKQGLYIKGTKSSYFDESLASAVVGFQQKYKAEILTPWRLRYGTGFVGNTTRIKLNALYGCKIITTTPTPTVQKCTDGTLYGQCSVNKPKYCDNGNLINKCSICGCSSGFECYTNESCTSIAVDCEYKNYKIAFILVENSGHPATQDDIDTINNLKQNTSETFSWATKGLASIDTSYPVIILRLENNPSLENITKEFYKGNPDNFHFVTIFNTYDDSGTQYHILARNNIKGIGLGIFNSTASFGSKGRLLGVNWMKDVDMYKPGMFPAELKLITGVNGILHETSHQWGAYVGFIDENGQRKNTLRNPYNPAHWDKKLETGYDLLDGFSWIVNGNGTFTAKTRTDYRDGYSNLDLYLMGLISKNEVNPVKLIVSDYDTKDIQPGTTISGTVKTISIQQIINAEGERECVSQ